VFEHTTERAIAIMLPEHTLLLQDLFKIFTIAIVLSAAYTNLIEVLH
jgi:hypothetical protein